MMSDDKEVTSSNIMHDDKQTPVGGRSVCVINGG